jgi:hypothetical protein
MQLTKNLSFATRDGGNNLVIVQKKIDTTGKYIAATAADIFGAAANSAHFIGNLVDSGCPRQTDGSYLLSATVIENDTYRMNMLELLAPVTNADNSGDELVMEDNTAKVGSKGASFDANKPVFDIYYFYKDINGKHRCRYFIGQFQPDGGQDSSKAKQWNQIKLKAYSIDANDSEAATAPTDSLFTNITVPKLDPPYQHGKVLEAT